MPVRQPRSRQPSNPPRELQGIVAGIVEAHDLRRRTRAEQLATVTEYLRLAAQRRAAENDARELIRNRHATRGATGVTRREMQLIEETWKRIRLPEPLRTSCDIGWLAHMTRARGQLDVPLAIGMHVLAELDWRPYEIANALEVDPRHVRRLLARTAV